MVQSIDLATLLAQLPNAQQLHHLVQAHPELFQALASELTRKKAEMRKKRITKSGGADPSGPLTREGNRATTGQRTALPEAPETPPEESETLRGRLLDTEV